MPDATPCGGLVRVPLRARSISLMGSRKSQKGKWWAVTLQWGHVKDLLLKFWVLSKVQLQLSGMSEGEMSPPDGERP
jgi:hypothetical protein